MNTLRRIGALVGWILLEAALLVAGFSLLSKLVLKAALGVTPLNEAMQTGLRFGLTAVAGFALYAWMIRRIEGRSCPELSWPGAAREISTGVIGGGLSLSLVIGVLAMNGAYRIVGVNPLGPMIPTLFLVFVLAQLEELVFRGILYRRVEAQFGTLAALLSSALLFGILHITNDNADLISVLSATLGGAFVGLFFTLTGRLWLPVFFHFAWNYAQLLWGTRVSGAEEFSGLAIAEFRGPDWITGGEAGPENSIVTLALLLVIIGVGVKLARSRGEWIGGSRTTSTAP